MKRPKIFYGWFVVAASFLLMVTIGETFWSFGVFFKPLEDEFGWSRTLVSSGYTAFLVGYSLSVIVSGRLVDRHSPRPVLLTSALITGLGISLCSQIQTISQLILFFFIAGIGSGAMWAVPSTSVLRWFHGRPGAGLALAITVTGSGVGALIFAPLLNYLILSYGWRATFLVVGTTSFAAMVLASLVIKPSPASIRTALPVDKSTMKPLTARGQSMVRTITSPAFMSLAFVVCTTSIAFQVITVHLVPMAIDAGISPTAAAAALGILGGFSIPGRLLSGFIVGKIGWQKGLAASVFGIALSIFWLLFLQATWMLYVFAFLFAISHGSRVVAQTGIIGDFFGMRSVGELIGIVSAIGNAVSSVAPYIAGFIFDATGSYFITLAIALVLLITGGIIATSIKKPLIAAGGAAEG